MIEKYNDFEEVVSGRITTQGHSFTKSLGGIIGKRIMVLKRLSMENWILLFLEMILDVLIKPFPLLPPKWELTIEGKSVVIIDDVLYTGRSIRAALTALDNYGRPQRYSIAGLNRSKV